MNFRAAAALLLGLVLTTPAVADTLLLHPTRVFDGTAIHRHPSAHVGMAVAAPNGLVVPVIRDADRRSVQEIARTRADLVGRARDGKLTMRTFVIGKSHGSRSGLFTCCWPSATSPTNAKTIAGATIRQRGTRITLDGVRPSDEAAW